MHLGGAGDEGREEKNIMLSPASLSAHVHICKTCRIGSLGTEVGMRSGGKCHQHWVKKHACPGFPRLHTEYFSGIYLASEMLYCGGSFSFLLLLPPLLLHLLTICDLSPMTTISLAFSHFSRFYVYL